MQMELGKTTIDEVVRQREFERDRQVNSCVWMCAGTPGKENCRHPLFPSEDIWVDARVWNQYDGPPTSQTNYKKMINLSEIKQLLKML